MPKDEKEMPMAQAGLVKYYSSDAAKIRMNPEKVIIFSILFAAIVLLLKFMA